MMTLAGQAGDLAGAGRWLQAMESAGLEPALTQYNNLMVACARQGDTKAAEAIMKRMEEKKVAPSRSSYASMVFSATKAGDVQKAEEWLKRMQEEGGKQKPGTAIYSAVINACARANK